METPSPPPSFVSVLYHPSAPSRTKSKYPNPKSHTIFAYIHIYQLSIRFTTPHGFIVGTLESSLSLCLSFCCYLFYFCLLYTYPNRLVSLSFSCILSGWMDFTYLFPPDLSQSRELCLSNLHYVTEKDQYGGSLARAMAVINTSDELREWSV